MAVIRSRRLLERFARHASQNGFVAGIDHASGKLTGIWWRKNDDGSFTSTTSQIEAGVRISTAVRLKIDADE